MLCCCSRCCSVLAPPTTRSAPRLPLPLPLRIRCRAHASTPPLSMGAVLSAIQRMFWAQVRSTALHWPSSLHLPPSHADVAHLAQPHRRAHLPLMPVSASLSAHPSPPSCAVQEMEIAVLGLQGAGKSTFVDVINVQRTHSQHTQRTSHAADHTPHGRRPCRRSPSSSLLPRRPACSRTI